MFELGAAWGQGKRVLPILVPPTTYSGMAAILTGTQAVTINSGADLSAMRDALLEVLTMIGRPTAEWERKRDAFLWDTRVFLEGGLNWLYTLISVRPEATHKVVGCFQIRRVAGRINAISAIGRAYWIEPHISLRGEWTTDNALHEDSHLSLYYTMKSPPEGEIVAVQKSEVHEGIIRLARRSEFAPLVGRACYSGYVHDLFGWRDNTPSMYAEPLEKPWQDVVAMVESGGADLFAAFSKRLGVR
jgi:hypothetical protein